jgi:hypothetical protein
MRVRLDVAEPLLSHEGETERRLDGMIETAQRGIESMLQRGYRRWFVMYSGGKDSTAALVLTLESLKDTDARVEVLYCDTQLEIPTLHQFAREFLRFLATRGVKTTVLTPDPEESFWVLVIGKGYPMPHNGFRWCTARLKVRPVERYINYCRLNRQFAENGLTALSLRLVDNSPAPPKPAWTARLAMFTDATKFALCWKPHSRQRNRRVLKRLEAQT